jgi:hypothetical protein
VGLIQLDIAKHEGMQDDKVKFKPSHRSRPMLASQETLTELRWKALVRRGRASKGLLLQLGGLPDNRDSALKVEATRGKASVAVEEPAESDTEDEEEEAKRAEERGRLLLAARSDFASALRLDPLDDVPRQELASLTIDPMQRRPSSHDISEGLALTSISQLDKEKKRNSQELASKAKFA